MKNANIVAEYCADILDLDEIELGDEFFYNSLPLCVIDAVFSIGVLYTSTRNTVERYCNYFNLKMFRNDKNDSPPAVEEQQPISELMSLIEEHGIQKFTQSIFDNRQRTSPTHGILKTEAVYQFSKVLNKYDVDYFQDIENIIGNNNFEKDIKNIKGQTSGRSLELFFMMAGHDEYIMPGRMILRFINDMLDKDISAEDARNILIEASSILKSDYNYVNMSPRLLDHHIWKHQREES
ncbi:MAG: hypothetical protein ACLFVB_10265 [Thermoplasmata archaeon]